MEKRPRRRILNEWGVVNADAEQTGPLGGSWLNDLGRWPTRFLTRREARHAARRLTDKYRYMRPAMVWTFKAVRLRIVVEWAR